MKLTDVPSDEINLHPCRQPLYRMKRYLNIVWCCPGCGTVWTVRREEKPGWKAGGIGSPNRLVWRMLRVQSIIGWPQA